MIHLRGAVELHDRTDNYGQRAVEVMKKPTSSNWRSKQRETLT